jgi:hypothetical protein
MKRIIRVLILIPVISLPVLIKAQTAKGFEMLTHEITYDVNINNCQEFREKISEDHDYHYLDYGNILPVYRNAYLNLLFDLAKDNKIDITDPDDKGASSNELLKRLDIYDTLAMIHPYPPYDQFDTIVVHRFDPEEVLKMRFREEWIYSSSTMEITKRVFSYGPVKDLYDHNNGQLLGTKVIFWVPLYDHMPTGNEKLLSQRIISTISLSPGPGNACRENIDPYKCTRYIEKLLDKAYHNQLKIFSPSSNISTGELIPMSGEDLFKSLAVADTFTLVRTYPPYDTFDTIVQTGISPDSIRQIRFIEEWYADTATMYFVKKVIGVALIPYQHEKNGLPEKPIFYAFFNDLWRPFDKKIILKNGE